MNEESDCDMWLVSIQDKESIGEQHVWFCIFHGTRNEALEHGRKACIALAESAKMGRCVPFVEPLILHRWYRTRRFRGYADDAEERVRRGSVL